MIRTAELKSMNLHKSKSKLWIFPLFFVLICLFSCAPQPEQPNIILIVADDLGYGELGCYGQEKIRTPHIDDLAGQGMKFTKHYSGSAVCAPSRCVLLTGMHSGHAYIRGNHEWGSRGDVWSFMAMLNDSTLEGQMPLPDSIVTFPELMQQSGYRTGLVGKWGLGAPHSEGRPTNQGFDYFFGYNCQRQAHTYYPLFLWENEKRVYLDNDTVPYHSGPLPEDVDPLDIESYRDFNLKEYAPDLMFDRIQQFVSDENESPFFLFWATPIPHLALQAPMEDVMEYVEIFGDEEPYLGNNGYFPNRYPKAAYAAMVTYLDRQIGELKYLLQQKGELENTIIIFTSDNGPSYTGGTASGWFDSGKPFDSEYGKGKGFLHEGGIRVPLIVSWPNHIEAGSESAHVSSFQDFFPTFGELIGFGYESTDGISMLPTWLGENQRSHEYLYWEIPEYGGQRALRMNKWKVLQKNIKQGNDTIALYDLESDLLERENVAEQFPEVHQQLIDFMNQEHETPVFDRFKMDLLDGQ